MLEVFPVTLPAALAAFGVVATCLLLAGQLRGEYVWPLSSFAALVSIMVVWHHYPRGGVQSRERVICNILLLLAVLVWGAFNVFYTSQHLITNRDPGTYTNAAIWLVDHPSLKIDNSTVFGSAEGISGASPGFSLDQQSNQLLAQGLHLLPILLGLMGRIVGVAHMLHLNVLFGMTALLAVYAFARLLARPYWALVVTLALAASMPFMYFSRDMYTEPLAATFTFGGLALIWLALRSKNLGVWFLAGLVSGAGTLTRIDGFLTIAELLLFVGVTLMLAKKADRIVSLKMTGVFIVGMLLTALVGWLDVSRLSTDYYASLHSQFHQEVFACIGAVVLSVLGVWLGWRTRVFAWLDRNTQAWRSAAGAVVVLCIASVLASRPLWYRGYDPPLHGVPVRNFAELSTEWVSWYIGPLLAFLGVIGVALAVVRAFQKRRLLLSAGLLVIGGTALVYLAKPSIAADQIWASRRLVPVILPGIAVFGGYLLSKLHTRYLKELQWKYVFAVIVGVAVLLGPLVTSRPLIHDRDTALLAPLNDICSALSRKHVAVLWIGTARSQLVQPTKSVCDIPAEGYGQFFMANDKPDRSVLSQAASNARRQGYTPVIGMYGSEVPLLLPGAEIQNLSTVSTYTENHLDQPVAAAPDKVDVTHNSIVLGVIEPDGSIKPLD